MSFQAANEEFRCKFLTLMASAAIFVGISQGMLVPMLGALLVGSWAGGKFLKALPGGHQ